MNTPKIRFKGFKDDWEQRKFSDLYAPLVERNSDLLPYNKTLSVATMTYKTDGNGAADSSLANYKRLRTGDIAFEGHTSKSFRYGRFVLNDVGDGIMSPRFSALRPLAQMPTNFWKYYIHYEPIMRKILVASTKAGTMMNELVIDEFLKSSVLVPSIEEQTRIGSILKNIDNLITLHQRKCDETKQLKKFMLQKMFPKNGEKNPEIRFEGFTDDWEQRKLDDWGTFYYGKSCPKWSVTQEATIPCIRYGELYTKFGAKIDRVYSYTNMPADNLRFSKGTEVLIPRVGEDPMDYNHCTWLSLPNIAIGEMISVFNTEQDPYFSAIMFNATLQKEFAMRVEGGSVTNLYFEKLKNIDVLYPSLDEQERIATYFGKLEHLITLHQRKCEKLKELKKYMLQNMFV